MLISVVVPVYNEQDSVGIFLRHLSDVAAEVDFKFEVVFVDDGSTDRTREILLGYFAQRSDMTAVFLSRNFGKESALMAGLRQASGDAVIPVDVDLQDPVSVIPLMVEKFKEGFEVVLAKRANRDTDSLSKRMMASLFYRTMSALSGRENLAQVGDFRLMSRRVVDEVVKLEENSLYMKGLMSWVGFSTTTIGYRRERRVSGRTKFTFSRLFGLAIDGIIAFSPAPLRILFALGSFVSVLSIVYATVLLVQTIAFGNPVPGYPSLIVSVLFLGGINLLGIAIVGEYLSKNLIESKRRPQYVVDQIHSR